MDACRLKPFRSYKSRENSGKSERFIYIYIYIYIYAWNFNTGGRPDAVGFLKKGKIFDSYGSGGGHGSC
jgi:hypothetical protein